MVYLYKYIYPKFDQIGRLIYVVFFGKRKPQHGAWSLSFWHCFFIIITIVVVVVVCPAGTWHCSLFCILRLFFFFNQLHHDGILSIIASMHDRFCKGSAHSPDTGNQTSFELYLATHVACFLSLSRLFIFTIFLQFSLYATREQAMWGVISPWWRLSICLSV